MTLWLNTYCVSMPLFMLAYLANSGQLASLPTLFVLIAIVLTFARVLYRSRMIVAAPIAGIFATVFLMLIFFLGKHLVIAGGNGLALAIKIVSYHLVFLSGLLIGFYDPPAKAKRAALYAVVLFALPLLFFLLVAKGRPPSEALFVFNRNPFAAYTITSSALLLGFATGRPLAPVGMYIVVVTLALILNSTLGALLAFLLAVMIYVGPQALFDRRVLLGALTLALVGGGSLAYIALNPNAFSNVEAIERLRFVVGIFSNLFTGYSGSWLELDMATAVRFAPSDELDMSAVFRILHWLNILGTLTADGPGALWFGGGTDWIETNKHRFVYRLAAHNEYIRVITEQGLLHAVVSFGAIYAAVLSLRRGPLFLPMMAATIYLASENTFNDFVTTTMFFLILGSSVAVERCQRAEARARQSLAGAFAHPTPSSLSSSRSVAP